MRGKKQGLRRREKDGSKKKLWENKWKELKKVGRGEKDKRDEDKKEKEKDKWENGCAGNAILKLEEEYKSRIERQISSAM